MDINNFTFDINEYDLSSLGEKFVYEAFYDYPYRIGFGDEEKRDFLHSRMHEASREIADAIIDKKMISVKDTKEKIQLRVEVVAVPMAEFYEMLSIIKKATGSTHFRYK